MPSHDPSRRVYTQYEGDITVLVTGEGRWVIGVGPANPTFSGEIRHPPDGAVFFNTASDSLYTWDEATQKWLLSGDIKYKVVPCTAAEVLTFHSARKEFIPAVPGYAIEIVRFYAFKDAGPAFVLGAAGTIQARYNNTAKTAVAGMAVAGFLDLTTLTNTYSVFGGVTFVTGSQDNAADPAGKSIVSGTSGNADYTGTGSPITIVLGYRLIPIIAANLPSP